MKLTRAEFDRLYGYDRLSGNKGFSNLQLDYLWQRFPQRQKIEVAPKLITRVNKRKVDK